MGFFDNNGSHHYEVPHIAIKHLPTKENKMEAKNIPETQYIVKELNDCQPRIFDNLKDVKTYERQLEYGALIYECKFIGQVGRTVINKPKKVVKKKKKGGKK